MFFDPICGRYYDRDAQMYYDPNTGKASLDADGAFYFDPTENAYYNEKDGCWYCHDDETGLYIDQTSSCDMGMMMMVMGWGPRYYDPETVSTNGVVVTTTTTTSLRGGATTTRTVWDGGWTESRVEEDYAADGCRVVRRYRGASDMQEFLAETSTYDFLGRLVSSSRPGMNDGTVTTTTVYDGVSSRRVSSSTTGSPAVSYAYDQLGELATTTRDGVTQTVATSYEWDADDDELYKVERTWRTIPSMFVDSVRTRETRTRLTGLSVYDLISYRTATGEDGLTAEETIWSICEYDDRYQPIFTGRIVSARRTGQGTEDLSLDRYGFTLSTQGIDGWTDSCLDGLGRETQVDVYGDEINDHSQTIRQYDLSGKVVASMVSASVSSLTLFVYDAFGRETMRSEGGSGSQRIFATGYDALGRPVYMGGDRHPVKIGYDAEGRKVSSRTTRDDGANWDETSWEFDSATGVNTSKTYADQSNVGHTYTVDGKPVRTTWARGSWKGRSYDLSGRLSGIAYSASSTPSVALSYICLDRISSATVNGVCTVSYGYDERELCVEEEMEIGTDDGFVLSRSYDLNRRPVTTSVANTTWYSAAPPFAAMTRSYDSENRVSGYDLGGGSVAVSVEYDGSRQTGLVYTLPCNAGTFRVSLTRQSGRPDWITGRAYAFGNESPVYQHQTTYDCLGRPTSIVDSRFGTRRWLYNRRSEVVGTSGDAQYPYDFSYSYDAIGNRLTSSDNFGTAVYAANNLNQYTAVNRTIDQLVLRSLSEGGSEQSNNFTYDADGNMTQDDRFTYAYDCENRLVSVTPLNPQYGSRSIENVYDHRSRRIKKNVKSFDGMSWNISETHVFVWDGWNIVFEQITFPDNTSRFVEYFWGNDLSGTEQGAGGVGGLLATRIDGVFYIPVYGGNGNIMMYVSESGSIAAQYDYDPYGNILQSSGPLATQLAFGFSTKYHDREVGLVAYQLRTYDPVNGRWLNRDPIEEAGGENLYAFCNNEPSFRFDFVGMLSESVVLQGVAAGWVGSTVTLNGRISVQINGEPYYLSMAHQPGMRFGSKGKSTSSLFLFKKNNPKRGLRLDYHEFPIGSNTPKFWHTNIDGSSGIAKVVNSRKLDHYTSPTIGATGKVVTLFKQGGRYVYMAGMISSSVEIYKAENRSREIVKQISGWGAAYAGGRIGSYVGAKLGMGIALIAGQSGPQVATPEEVVTVPVLGALGGIGGGLIGGFMGMWSGMSVSEIVFDWTFTPLEKEEWEVGCAP